MATYLFVPYPASGPVNLTLPIARELVNRGQTVIYYLPEEWSEIVQATGALFRPYQSRMVPSLSTREPQQAQESRLVLPQVVEQMRADAPDVIVHDPFSAWTSIAVRVLAIPTILLHSSYPMNELFHMADLLAHLPSASARFREMREVIDKENTELAEICASYQVAPVDYTQLASSPVPLNIVFIPQAFQPAGETFDERYLFVGPSLGSRPQTVPFAFEQLSDERPLLYISLGSLFTNQSAFFKQCLEAFGSQVWQVVLSYGRQVEIDALGSIPENVVLAPPGDDLTSRLVQVEERGDCLSETELISTIFLLIVAGHETTINLIGNGTLALLQHPEQMNLLRADPSLVPSAIKELLRYAAPVSMSSPCWASEDIPLHDQVIRKGDVVFVSLIGANTDPRWFPDPEVLNSARQNNHHLAFGKGIHYCLGAPLARLKGQIALDTLLRRLPHLKLASDPEQLTWAQDEILRGLTDLPVTF